MKKWLLTPCIWLMISCSAYAEHPAAPPAVPPASPSAEAAPNTAQPAPAAPRRDKWYIGITYEIGSFDTVDSNEPYYVSQGYYRTGGCCVLHSATGLKFFGGYPVNDNLDAEFGLSLTSTYLSNTYTSGSNIIYSKRTTNVGLIYAAAILRPGSESWHNWFLKLGAHYSSYDVSRDVTGGGSAPNLGTIIVGDKLPTDGNRNGLGGLVSVGVDWGQRPDRKYRLELTHYTRVGGGPYAGTLLSIGVTYRFY